MEPVVIAPHALAAAGKHAAITAGHGAHHLALVNGQRLRLLAIHVLAVLHGVEGNQRVPMVRRGDQHGVNIRPPGDLVKIVVGSAIAVAVASIDRAFGLVPVAGHHVANRHDLHLFEAQETAHVAAALAPHADATHDNPVIGAKGPGVEEEGGSAGNHCRLFQKGTSSHTERRGRSQS